MKRRHLLAAAGAVLAAPRALHAQPAKVLKFVPIADLAITDPIVTTALTTRCHAYLVFDTLYGLDSQYRAVPQMIDGHVIDNDRKQWTLHLRPGLRFHDDTPVLARDVVASLQRWSKRDSYGATLFQSVDELAAVDDNTVRFRLKRPFALLADALGKTGPNMAAIMPDPTTAANALLRGEVDWVEAPSPDLMPVLARSPDLTIKVADQVGIVPILRFNALQPPFNNPEIRRIALHAVDQREVMAAYTSDASITRTGVGAFPVGTPMANAAGLEAFARAPDVAALSKALVAAGYAGEPVVLMAGQDNPVTASASQVVADALQKIGFKVDFLSVDSATVTQRRTSREAPAKGGWSLFIVGYAGADMISPAESFPLRGNGAQAWFGWPSSPGLEQLRTAWMDSTDEAERRALAERIQLQLWQDVPYAPLGQIVQKTAMRRNITGVLDGFAKFYNVDKT